MNLKQEVQFLLKKYGLKPSKFRGQHFLVDTGILKEVAQLAEIRPSETILEIGAGIGNLTRELLTSGAQVIAVEKDREFARVLKKILGQHRKLTVAAGDVLQFDEQKIVPGYKVVGNIPYYITGPIIRKFLESKNQPKLIILMVQKEVGERMVAQPPRSTFLSMMVSLLASVSTKKKVPAGAFWPAPKVDSVVVLIRPTATLNRDKKRLIELMRLGFRQPRKLLLNNLVQGLAVDKVVLEKVFAGLGFSLKLRAHEMTLGEWQALEDNLQKHYK